MHKYNPHITPDFPRPHLLVLLCSFYKNKINLSSAQVLTQTGLDDLYGAVVVLDGLVVLVHVAQGGGYVVVSLGQQATVCRQVLQLQSQTLLEVFKRLWVVAFWQTETF